MKVRIRENSFVARLAAIKLNSSQMAIVFGNTIHLHNTKREDFLKDTSWVCHELKHVEQYKKNGFAGFLAKYLLQWIRNGYHKNIFEIEARANEQNESLLNETEFI
jgi:hypothetical protein